MESYQLYYNFREKVEHLPGGTAAIRVMPSLPYTGFARCTPCDGSGETPQVPPYLPRALPTGQYSWGAYCDTAYLFIVLDAKEGPGPEALAQRDGALDQLIIFQPDGAWYRTLQIALDGSHQALSHRYSHNPRTAACEEPEWHWRVERLALGENYHRTLWEISLADLMPHIRCGELRLSLSKTTIRSHEAVAWGAYGIWNPRFDECGVLTLDSIAKGETVLRNANVHLDASGHTASIDLQWESIPPESSGPSLNASEAWRESDWNRGSIRVNHRMRSFPLATNVTVGPFTLASGWNELHVNSRQGTHARVFLEVAPTQELVLPEYAVPIDLAEAQAWSDAWLGKLVEAKTLPQKFQRWMARGGSAVLARGFRGAAPEEWLIWGKALATYLLTLQRDDGTFSGYHLSSDGATDVPWRGGAYDSGQVGELWIRTYQATQDPQFLEASRKLVRAYAGYRVEFNPNFAAFALYHLAAHYEVTGEGEALEHLVYYLQWCVLPNLLPLGFHGGHNYYSVYAAIILRALALGYKALPNEHTLKHEVLRAMTRMSNQAMSRLQPDGSFDSRDRHFVGETLWLDGLFAVYLAKPEFREKLQPVLGFILSKAICDSCPNADWMRFDAANLACSPAVIDFLYHSSKA